MRPIKLNDKQKEALQKKFAKQFLESLEKYTFGSSTKVSFEADINVKKKDKIQIVYSPSAWIRMNALVDNFSSEVSWFGLVEKCDPNMYYVYDVLVCKQQVSGVKVDTQDEDMLEFLANLTDEQAEHMHFQAHSHVNMSTSASGTDLQNQEDILGNMPGNDGFYIFQIWNKRGDISTYLYDFENNMYYDSSDVKIVVEDPDYGALEDFIGEAKSLVSGISATNAGNKTGNELSTYRYGNNYPYYYGGYYGNEDGYDYARKKYVETGRWPLQEEDDEMMELEYEEV